MKGQGEGGKLEGKLGKRKGREEACRRPWTGRRKICADLAAGRDEAGQVTLRDQTTRVTTRSFAHSGRSYPACAPRTPACCVSERVSAAVLERLLPFLACNASSHPVTLSLHPLPLRSTLLAPANLMRAGTG